MLSIQSLGISILFGMLSERFKNEHEYSCPSSIHCTTFEASNSFDLLNFSSLSTKIYGRSKKLLVNNKSTDSFEIELE